MRRPAHLGRTVALAGGACVLGFVAILAAHAPGVGLKRCPFASGGGTGHAQALAGTRPARSRYALGFALETSRRPEIEAWATAHGAPCQIAQVDGALECTFAALGAIPGHDLAGHPASLFFQFGRGETLRRVTLVAHFASAEAAAAHAQRMAGMIATHAGAEAVGGQHDPVQLAAGALRQSTSEYRFSDYYAQVRTTNLGTLNTYLTTERYQAL